MVISHKYRYIFIEIPLTASWAIHHELCDHYAGEAILHKHATYSHFARQATADQRSYFAFASVRHPLDAIVSHFVKLKTDHRASFSSSLAAENLLSDYADLKKYEFIQENNASFTSYFASYHQRPYSDLIDYSARALNFVIRYENLQEDFSKVLEILGMEQVRPIPVVNRTEKKNSTWESYFSPESIKRAKRVCGPFMQQWGYEFPGNWGQHEAKWKDMVQYRFYNVLRGTYINHFKYNTNFLGNSIRKLRALFR